MLILNDGIRIEPYDTKGIHLVQNEGGEYIYLKYSHIQSLIDDLKLVLETRRQP